MSFMSRSEENQIVKLRTEAMGSNVAREKARQECRRILSVGEGSIRFRAEVSKILASISPSESAPRGDVNELLLRLQTKLAESRGSSLSPEIACELGEFADIASGPVSANEKTLLLLWVNRPEAFSALRWRRMMARYKP